MKTRFTIIAFFTLFIGFSQNGNLNGQITENIGIGFPGLMVELLQDGKITYKTQSDIDGKYSFENIPFGTYSVRISAVAMKEDTAENIMVDFQNNVYNFIYPKPCVANKKICPKGHNDNIIPIIYGFPTQKTMKKAENKKVKLGGCTQYCEKWHCEKHDLDF